MLGDVNVVGLGAVAVAGVRVARVAEAGVVVQGVLGVAEARVGTAVAVEVGAVAAGVTVAANSVAGGINVGAIGGVEGVVIEVEVAVWESVDVDEQAAVEVPTTRGDAMASRVSVEEGVAVERAVEGVTAKGEVAVQERAAE
jgi:hypothetical protein